MCKSALLLQARNVAPDPSASSLIVQVMFRRLLQCGHARWTCASGCRTSSRYSIHTATCCASICKMSEMPITPLDAADHGQEPRVERSAALLVGFGLRCAHRCRPCRSYCAVLISTVGTEQVTKVSCSYGRLVHTICTVVDPPGVQDPRTPIRLLTTRSTSLSSTDCLSEASDNNITHQLFVRRQRATSSDANAATHQPQPKWTLKQVTCAAALPLDCMQRMRDATIWRSPFSISAAPQNHDMRATDIQALAQRPGPGTLQRSCIEDVSFAACSVLTHRSGCWCTCSRRSLDLGHPAVLSAVQHRTES